ncbi:MAG: hypothetical protein ACK5HS_02230 [Mycoplasmatales bacterium]
MYIHTKKVVIISLVVLITLFSIIIKQYNTIHSIVNNITFITPEYKEYDSTYQKLFSSYITDQINIYNEENIDNVNKVDYAYSAYQLSSLQEAKTQFSQIVQRSESIMIYSEFYNDFLFDVIKEYPDKQFYLINNNSDQIKNYKNIINIKFDYSKFIDLIIKNISKEDKVLFIYEDKYTNLDYLQAYLDKHFDSEQYTLLKVEDVSKGAQVISQLNNAIDSGVTKVISLDIYNQKLLVDTITKYNSDVQSEIEKLNKELEEGKKTKEEVEELSPSYVSLFSIGEELSLDSEETDDFVIECYSLILDNIIKVSNFKYETPISNNNVVEYKMNTNILDEVK